MTAYARTLDVLVIGADQAGLALGFHLKKTPFRFQLVDRHARVGDSWRKRYASLVLFTPAPTVRSQALRCLATLMDIPPKTKWPTI